MTKRFLAALVAGPLLAGSMAGLPAAVAQTQAPALEVPAGTYRIDPTHASVTWQVNHLGLSNYTARFTKFDATLEFDPASPEKSRVTVTIDPKSVRTDFPFPEKEDFDAKIAGPDFLDAGKYPEIRFVSTKVERLGADTGRMHGDLTFHGVTKPVVMDVKLVGAKTHPMRGVGAMGFSAVTTFKRSDFGVTNLVPMVGDEVTVRVEAEFLQQK